MRARLLEARPASLYGGGSHRAEPTVVLTLAVADDWSDDANTRGRCWVQLDLWPDGNEIRMSFIDPVLPEQP